MSPEDAPTNSNTSRDGTPSGSNGLTRRFLLVALAGLPALPVMPTLFGASSARADDAPPLPSWNDGPAKQGILDFLRATTDPASKTFVPPEERIATFDQDGTLWVEHPIYTQVVYCLCHAALKRETPYPTFSIACDCR